MSRSDIRYISNLWAGNFTSSSICLTSALSLHSARGPGLEACLSFYDADGVQFNQTMLKVEEEEQATFLELEPFLEGCKLDAGIQHCHIKVESQEPHVASIRLFDQRRSFLLTPGARIEHGRSDFMPLRLSLEHFSILALVNSGEKELEIRSKLLLGKRSPELAIKLNALSSKVISIDTEFSEFVEALDGVQYAYLRLGLLGEGGGKAFMHLIEGHAPQSKAGQIVLAC